MGCCCVLRRRRARAARAMANWTRVIRKLKRIRKLQKLFHNSGEWLQRFPRRLLDQLSKPLKKD